MAKTVELKSQKELDAWLAEKGDSIKVITMSTAAKKWSPMTGFFTNAKTYTVIYEESGK